MTVGRLAPTPSGHLHLGNALAFGAAYLAARDAGGRLLLRIEDVDRARARPEVEAGIREDLAWLGIRYDLEVPRQSQRRYSVAGLPVYRCTCNRARRQQGACTCRTALAGSAGDAPSLVRFATPPGTVVVEDAVLGRATLEPGADPVLLSREGAAQYNLAVVLDDIRDGVTQVVRGADLFEQTAVQIRMYEALGAAPPVYAHVPVLLGPDGKKLSKSHGSLEVRALRAEGWTPEAVWRRLLPVLGLPECSLADAPPWDPKRTRPGPIRIETLLPDAALRAR